MTALRGSMIGGAMQNRMSETGAAPAGVPQVTPQATPQGAPKVDVSTARVLTSDDLLARAQGRLTPHAKQMLRAHGVPPEPQAVANFFLSQAKIRP